MLRSLCDGHFNRSCPFVQATVDAIQQPEQDMTPADQGAKLAE